MYFMFARHQKVDVEWSLCDTLAGSGHNSSPVSAKGRLLEQGCRNIVLEKEARGVKRSKPGSSLRRVFGVIEVDVGLPFVCVT